MGRKSKYTPELAAEICEQLKTGKTLRAVCRDNEHFPSEMTVRDWAHSDLNGFSSQYLHAREIGYMAMADEILEIADDARGDTYEDAEGRTKTDWERLGRSKLRSDVRQWLLSKALPKVYGQKLDLAHSGHIAGSMTEEERIKRLNALIAKGLDCTAQNNTEPTDASDLA